MSIPISSTVQVQGDVLGPLLARLRNKKPALDAAGAVLEGGIDEAFALGDRTWPDLAPWTQEERAALGYGPNSPKLIRTGEYLASFVQEVDDDAVSIVSTSTKFDTHQFGGTTDTGHAVPARPVELDDETVDGAIDTFWQAIVGDA